MESSLIKINVKPFAKMGSISIPGALLRGYFWAPCMYVNVFEGVSGGVWGDGSERLCSAEGREFHVDPIFVWFSPK